MFNAYLINANTRKKKPRRRLKDAESFSAAFLRRISNYLWNTSGKESTAGDSVITSESNADNSSFHSGHDSSEGTDIHIIHGLQHIMYQVVDAKPVIFSTVCHTNNKFFSRFHSIPCVQFLI